MWECRVQRVNNRRDQHTKVLNVVLFLVKVLTNFLASLFNVLSLKQTIFRHNEPFQCF